MPRTCPYACREGTRSTSCSCFSPSREGRGCTSCSCVSPCREGRGCSPRRSVSACRADRGCSPRRSVSACREGRGCTPRRSLSPSRGGRGCTQRSCFSACREGRGYTPRSCFSPCRGDTGYTRRTGVSAFNASTASVPPLSTSARAYVCAPSATTSKIGVVAFDYVKFGGFWLTREKRSTGGCPFSLLRERWRGRHGTTKRGNARTTPRWRPLRTKRTSRGMVSARYGTVRAERTRVPRCHHACRPETFRGRFLPPDLGTHLRRR